MESDKRNIWLGVLFLLLLSIAIAWLTYYAVIRQPGNPWQHLPENTRAVIRINGPAFFGKAEIGTSHILKETAAYPALHLPVSWLLKLDSVYRHSPEQFEILRQQEILLALFPIDQRWELALLSDASDTRKRKAWMDILREAGALMQEEADGGLIVKLDEQTTLFGTLERNLWAMTGSREGMGVMKTALRRTYSGEQHSQWKDTERKAAVSLFVNASLMESFLQQPGSMPHIEFAERMEEDKLVLDVLFKRNEIYLSGYPQALSGVYAEEKTSSAVMAWPGDVPEGIQGYATLGELVLNWKRRGDADSLMGEVVLRFAVLRLEETTAMLQLFPLDSSSKTFVSGFRESLNKDPGLMQSFRLELDSFFAASDEGDSLQWQMMLAGQSLLASRNQESLRRLAAAVQGGRTMAAKPSSLALAEKLPDSAIDWGLHLLPLLRNEKEEKELPAHQLAWARIPGTRNLLTLVLAGSDAKGIKRPAPRQALAGNITHRPFPVWDHRNNRYNVLVADDRNVLTLFSPLGEIMWDYQMDERLMGDIQVVDAYRNSKFQYLFNTASTMYLLDVLGNDVEGFPVKLPSAASNALVALDYDGRKDYRILVAGHDKIIRNFDIKGKEVDGWKKPEMEERVSVPIQYLAMYGKDYLIIADEAGEVIMTDRRGDIRVRIRRSFENAPQSPFFMQRMDGETRIITTDVQGQIRALQRNGRIQTQKMDVLSSSHFFLYDAFSSSRDFDYIFFDEGFLRVMDKQGSVLLETAAEGPVWQAPVIIHSGNERLIALTDSLNDRIYLYKFGNDQVYKTLDGRFPPLLIDLDQDLKPEILTADRNKLILQALEE